MVGTLNIYTVGTFMNTVDFDPNSGITNLTSISSQSTFIQKLDFNGNLIWVKSLGGVGADIKIDTLGNPHITGYFAGTTDFDPNAGVNNLTSNGTKDIFI